MKVYDSLYREIDVGDLVSFSCPVTGNPSRARNHLGIVKSTSISAFKLDVINNNPAMFEDLKRRTYAYSVIDYILDLTISEDFTTDHTKIYNITILKKKFLINKND